MSSKRLYILFLLCGALFLCIQKSQAGNRIQLSQQTADSFLKKSNAASCPIQDMLINLDENDDDETSSTRSKCKLSRAFLSGNIKFSPGIQEIFTLPAPQPTITHLPQKHFHKHVLSLNIPIGIAICCLRI